MCAIVEGNGRTIPLVEYQRASDARPLADDSHHLRFGQSLLRSLIEEAISVPGSVRVPPTAVQCCRSAIPAALFRAIVDVCGCRQLGRYVGRRNFLPPWPAMIDKLEFVIALARERHFGRAAEACGVSQPTLSAGLKQLEDTLGVLLVQRGSRFRNFTPEGERVLTWARRIVGDARGLRQEIDALKRGLVGHIRIAAIPTALAMVATLTTPFHARHPNVRFTVLARTSHEMLELIENLELDAGLTYIDNEPLGRVTAIPLYREQYHLLTSSDGTLGDRGQVTWEEVAQIPLCLLTPDTQTRRILDDRLRQAGAEPSPMLESDSMVVLYAHVRTGRWSTIMPGTLVDALGLMGSVHAIPILEANSRHTIGLIVPDHDPAPPITAALIAQARQLAKTLLQPADGPTG